MEETFLKQQKEVEELKVDNANAYQDKNEYKGKLTRGMHKWTTICKNNWSLLKI